jgi:hypothetical protein
MWEFERFCHALSDTHRKNQEAMTAVLGSLFVLSFELKAARISADDLKGRMSAIVAAMKEQTGKPLSGVARAARRYPEIDLYDTIISNDVTYDVLVKGMVNQEAIRSSLDRSRYFISVSDEPAWVTVWHYWDRTDDEFNAAFEKMTNQFAERQITVHGELLHVLGLLLFLARVGLLEPTTQDDVVAAGKEYIDDLYNQKRLEPLTEPSDVRFGGWGGLGICEQDTAEYRELLEYLGKKLQQVVEDSYPAKGSTLLEEMETDADLYLRRLCFTQSDDNLYPRIPILSFTDPDVFVTSFLAQPPAHQRTIMRAFKTRYEGGSLDRELAPERAWLTTVRTQLLAKAEGMTGIGKYGLSEFIRMNLTPVQEHDGKN